MEYCPPGQCPAGPRENRSRARETIPSPPKETVQRAPGRVDPSRAVKLRAQQCPKHPMHETNIQDRKESARRLATGSCKAAVEAHHVIDPVARTGVKDDAADPAEQKSCGAQQRLAYLAVATAASRIANSKGASATQQRKVQFGRGKMTTCNTPEIMASSQGSPWLRDRCSASRSSATNAIAAAHSDYLPGQFAFKINSYERSD